MSHVGYGAPPTQPLQGRGLPQSALQASIQQSGQLRAQHARPASTRRSAYKPHAAHAKR
jgi:hypothetical protein